MKPTKDQIRRHLTWWYIEYLDGLDGLKSQGKATALIAEAVECYDAIRDLIERQGSSPCPEK